MVWPPVLQPLVCVLGREGGNFSLIFALNGASWETAACCQAAGAGGGLVLSAVCAALPGVLGWPLCIPPLPSF